MQDLNGQIDSVMNTQESNNHKPSNANVTQFNAATNEQATLGKNLFKMKKAWSLVYDDLHFGLDQLLISGISDVQNDPFYQAMVHFRTKLHDVLPIIEAEVGTTFDVSVSYSKILTKIHPMLYSVQVQADAIVALERYED